jgi:ABC-type bacteriocin/lantibiotic exporter with double-glycine peptidase domain
MKKTLFLIFSGAIVIFSIICICSAPIINNVLTDSENWKTHNCQHQSDELKNLEKINANKDTIKLQKKIRNQCNREKAMYGLEYSSLILDVTLGSICTILGLLHYFDVAKPFEKVSGIIGLATGVI